jgi:RHS repeat-associated protein
MQVSLPEARRKGQTLPPDWDQLQQWRIVRLRLRYRRQFRLVALRGIGRRTVHTHTLTTTTAITYAYPSTALTCPSWPRHAGQGACPGPWAAKPMPGRCATSAGGAGDAANRLDYFYEDGVLTDLGWDANGNLRTQGTSVYTWDAANRLVSAEVDGVVSAFEYNGLGQRMAQTVNGLTTEYVLDVAGGLPEVIVAATGGASTYYVQVQGQILGQYGSGAWAYTLPDHLGSLRQLVDGDGQVSLAQSFDPFGGAFESSGADASDFGYTGEAWDSGAELLFLRARYYDPYLNRFISKDVFPGQPDSPQSLNGWSYVGNNPIKHADPSGLIYIEGWGYTCDDPAVVNGMGPDGKPCIPAPPGATLETLNLCSPLYPGDESWKTRPECNYHPPSSEVFDDLFSDLDGYVEGVVGTVVAAGCQMLVKGMEVVYDFQSGERANFTYSGTARYGLLKDLVAEFDFLGKTVIGPTGVDTSLFGISLLGYAGPVWGFDPDRELKFDYSGPFWAFGQSVGVSPVSTGVSIFSSVDEKTGMPNFKVSGAVVPVGGGISKSPLKFSLPAEVSLGWTAYEIRGSAYDYKEKNPINYRNVMVRDVVAGTGSPLQYPPEWAGINLRQLAADAVLSR